MEALRAHLSNWRQRLRNALQRKKRRRHIFVDVIASKQFGFARIAEARNHASILPSHLTDEAALLMRGTDARLCRIGVLFIAN
jgi:hypothetical protein